MRDPENIRAIEQGKPDMMGFICWDGSSRNVSHRPSYLPSCTRVGVFVNPTLEHVCAMVSMLGLSAIQLHGSEAPEFCRTVGERTGLPIIKAFSIKSDDDLSLTSLYDNVASLFLFDTKCKSVGGSGEQFDWDILSHYKGDKPFLLSGGIGPEDVEKLRRWHHPRWIGIDINSRFETSPAQKDAESVISFINKIRNS